MTSGLSEFQNRTLICSVLFIDIVDYSRKPVVEQSQLKDRFNALLSQALRGVALNDRIILDTGDGAAISFIGDPEDALFVATGLRDVIAAPADSAGPALSTRMGINLGPVRLVKDINGQPNVIGDGINVAQRVMTFAKPGQVLVSRSYYEVVSRLSDESSRLFSYEGARTDKHIREHEVYAVGSIPGVRRRLEDDGGTRAENRAGAAGYARLSTRVRNAVSVLLGSPRLVTAFAVLAILGIALGARAYRTNDDAIGIPAANVAASASAPAPEVTPEPPLPPIKGLPPEPTPPLAEAAPAAEAPAVETAPGRRAPRVREKVREQVVRAESPRPPPAPEPAPPPAPAAVSFAITPWGEVHIDGRMHGVSPPLQELELAPGRHRIEIRNGGFVPHVVTVNARPGQRLRIKHKFN